jgi:hypothetical protein
MAGQKPIHIKKPGDLHRRLNVPQGKPIPKAKLNQATHSRNPTTKQEANYAKNVLIPGGKKARSGK